MDIPGFFARLIQLIQHEQLWAPLGVVLPTIAFIGFWFGRYFPKHRPSREMEKALEDTNQKLKEALEREAKNDELWKTVLSDESELWRLHPPKPPINYSNPINLAYPVYTYIHQC
jgi:hypothetical protein